MEKMSNNFIDQIEHNLKSVANSNIAAAKAQYMKNLFPFLGISFATRRDIVKDAMQNISNLDITLILDSIKILWNKEHREYQYVALDILKACIKKCELEHINFLLELVKQKSWWDSVDELAKIINKIIYNNIKEIEQCQKLTDEAIMHPNLWIRRVAILHQLGWKNETNTELLFHYILLTAHEKDFFIRKAIGWALRDYAKHNRQAVYEFADANKKILSGLSYREATKHRTISY
jgi:3-methyladenine DNA glycosylase AlkD